MSSVEPASYVSSTTSEHRGGSAPTLDFDGTTVLCQVCGDKASGFHYGVHSCEGCKGFFRRSIQQKIQYKPCTKNQNCSILRINRNRCQYCRLKKCISVGMSRDAVRFGRVPKREKAKILAAMQSVNQKYQERALLSELEDDSRLVRVVVQAHLDSCEFTWAKVGRLLEAARRSPSYSQASPGYACPLSPRVLGTDGLLRDSQLFGPHIKAVVEFAKQLPGFLRLPEEDRVTLLKSSVFEVLLVWLACMFDSESNTAACLNGQLVRKDAFSAGSQPKFLLDSMFNFAQQLNALRLSDAEVGLFCACVVLTTERPGLRSLELIGRIHHKLDAALRSVLAQNHPHLPELYDQLARKVHDLKTLNTLHSDMIRSLKEPEDRAATRPGSAAAARCPHAAPARVSLPVAAAWAAGDPASAARDSNHSPHSLSSGYVGSEEGSVQSPSAGRLTDSSPSPDGRAAAASAAASHPHLVAALQPRPLPLKRKTSDDGPAAPHRGGAASPCPSASGPASPCSLVSSPRSVCEDRCSEPPAPAALLPATVKVEEPDDHMPLLKQALSKPSLVATDPGSRAAMEAAFVPHKKFRWMRRENESEPATESSDEPDEEKVSRTPTLSRILGAPPQRGWSAEQIRQREAVQHLLSMHAGFGMATTTTTTTGAVSPQPRLQCPYSGSERHSPAPHVSHVPVALAPVPPHHHVRQMAARLSPIPAPAHSPVAEQRSSPAPAPAASPVPSPQPPPPTSDLNQLQPLNLSKKVAQRVSAAVV